MNEFWLTRTAAEFWEASGGYNADLELAILLALPITVERLAGLRVSNARQWLEDRGIGVVHLKKLADRPLRACLVALGGASNFILVDAQDTPEEQLFSLAHEAAHFLLDYLQPRRQAERKLSASILPVLDGKRLPTLEERTHSLLANLSLQPYQHLMERQDLDEKADKVIQQAEDRADRLAIELLAPFELVIPQVKKAIANVKEYAARQELTCQLLTSTYSLPLTVAKDYAYRLLEETGAGRSFREWLNLP